MSKPDDGLDDAHPAETVDDILLRALADRQQQVADSARKVFGDSKVVGSIHANTQGRLTGMIRWFERQVEALGPDNTERVTTYLATARRALDRALGELNEAELTYRTHAEGQLAALLAEHAALSEFGPADDVPDSDPRTEPTTGEEPPPDDVADPGDSTFDASPQDRGDTSTTNDSDDSGPGPSRT